MQQAESATRPRGWLRRLDDLVFSIERAVVATLLMAITLMIFLDVVYRRLISEDTKLGTWLIERFHVHDAAAVARMHGTVAPAAYALIGFALLWFCTASAERELGKPLFGREKPFAFYAALGLFGVISGTLWLMLHAESRVVYMLLGGALAFAYVGSQLRARTQGFGLRVAGALVSLSGFVWFALHYFPQGFAWSKEMSLMLLMWVGFLGASVCVHDGKHLFLEAVVSKLPARLHRVAIALGFGVAALFCLLMTVLGYRYTFDPEIGAVHMGGVLELTQLPDWVSAVPLPIAFGIAGLRFLAAAISHLTGGDYGALAKAEGVEEAERMAQAEGTT